MKKSILVMSTLLCVLVLVSVAVSPVAASGYTVISTRVNRSGQAVVFLAPGSSYLTNTTSVSEFYSYATYCTVNDESGFVVCTIHKDIVAAHGGETGYVIVNSSGDKAWFTVPESKEELICSH